MTLCVGVGEGEDGGVCVPVDRLELWDLVTVCLIVCVCVTV